MSGQLEVGQPLPGFRVELSRVTLARYAGASGDFNPIHYNDAAASALGLPGVIAHGMLTMGMGLRVVTDWVEDPARILSYYVRFTKPVVVPATGAIEIAFRGSIAALSESVVTLAIEATCDGAKVLGAASAEVSLD